MYLPSDGATAYVVRLDLNFQGQKFQTLIFPKQRVSIKTRVMTLIEVNNWYLLPNGITTNVLGDFDLNFQG